jgi:hypothetical protein
MRMGCGFAAHVIKSSIHKSNGGEMQKARKVTVWRNWAVKDTWPAINQIPTLVWITPRGRDVLAQTLYGRMVKDAMEIANAK